MTFVEKYDWADVYICIYTRIYNADLHGHGTAVVNKSVWQQSGNVFVVVFYSSFGQLCMAFGENSFFFGTMLPSKLYDIGGVWDVCGYGDGFLSFPSYKCVPCPLYFSYFSLISGIQQQDCSSWIVYIKACQKRVSYKRLYSLQPYHGTSQIWGNSFPTRVIQKGIPCEAAFHSSGMLRRGWAYDLPHETHSILHHITTKHTHQRFFGLFKLNFHFIS